MSKCLLRTAGLVQIGFAGLHGLMPLGWRESLACLSAGDRATLFSFNGMAAYALLVFAYLLPGHTRSLATPGAGRAAAAGIAGFWILHGAAEPGLNSIAGVPGRDAGRVAAPGPA